MTDKQENGMEKILLVGDNRLIPGIVVCLLQAQQKVTVYTRRKHILLDRINLHLDDLNTFGGKDVSPSSLEFTTQLENGRSCDLVLVLTPEDLEEKKACIQQIEEYVPPGSPIAVNTESFPLNLLQEDCSSPDRIVGVNWSEPAHTTKFLELIINAVTNEELVSRLLHWARDRWQKDPYVVSGGEGVRSRLLSAMMREASYLVQNGYASVEDIDRACRNDPGYYLPFAGCCRYMDLTGASVYGKVMKDLYPDLAKSKKIPLFFKEILSKGGEGMDNGKGFYQYNQKDIATWDLLFRKFSYDIKKIIDKYPFHYKDSSLVETK